LMVSNAAGRASSVVKISQPERANVLASAEQQLAVNVLEFNAKDYLDKVPAPTDHQLKEQFDKYKDKPSNGTGLNFGYKYPNRVKYDAVEVRREDVKKGVPPITTEDAALYYSQHKTLYVATTAPTTGPTANFNLKDEPTTRQMPYEEAKPKIIQTLLDERTDELLAKVRDAVRDTMKSDYDAYKVATDSKAATLPVSSLGVPYTNSPEYIAKLKAKILADFKVEVRTDRAEGLRTPTELTESSEGKAKFATMQNQIPFAMYLTGDSQPNSPLAGGLVEEFVKNPNKNILRGELKPIAVWEPAPAFENPMHDAYLIVRVTEASPEHVPASLDEVKAKVAEDVKLAAAYDKAKQAAQAALDAAKNKWLYTVANEEGKKAFTTGLFQLVDNTGAATVPGYDLKDSAAITDFKKGAVNLLSAPLRSGQALKPPTTAQVVITPATQPTTQASTKPTTKTVAAATAPTSKPTTSPIEKVAAKPTSAPVMADLKDHPIGLIELPSDAKVVVAELDQLKPLWTKDQQAAYNTQLANIERNSAESALRRRWFNYDQLVKRLDFVPAAEKPNKPKAPEPENIPLGG
jgi:hypothetical protein